MSVLVKGMKMPKRCIDCDYITLDFGEMKVGCRLCEIPPEKEIDVIGWYYFPPRPDYCPLIEIRGEGESYDN